MMLNKELLRIIVCPQCKGAVVEENNGLACKNCLLFYPIEDDIPTMLIEEAKKISEDGTTTVQV